MSTQELSHEDLSTKKISSSATRSVSVSMDPVRTDISLSPPQNHQLGAPDPSDKPSVPVPDSDPSSLLYLQARQSLMELRAEPPAHGLAIMPPMVHARPPLMEPREQELMLSTSLYAPVNPQGSTTTHPSLVAQNLSGRSVSPPQGRPVIPIHSDRHERHQPLAYSQAGRCTLLPRPLGAGS